MRPYLGRARAVLGSWLGMSAEAPQGPGSLAYRTNQAAIWRGEIPDKYTRLVEVIPGDRILEIGSAEGVLALLLAGKKEKVIALERHRHRHEAALQLQAHWRQQGKDVDRCEMLAGDIRDRLDLLRQVDTLLAVRTIYHLHEDIHRVFEHVGKHVRNVVLCGNEGRVRRYTEANGEAHTKTQRFESFASLEGMTGLLEGCGYTIIETVADGDPVVVGVNESLGSGTENYRPGGASSGSP